MNLFHSIPVSGIFTAVAHSAGPAGFIFGGSKAGSGSDHFL